jgi:deoxycytidylate deaminase
MSDESFQQSSAPANGDKALLSNIQFPELFFAIVAPIGVDAKSVILFLHESLKKVNYQSRHIKVTELMKQVPTNVELHESPLDVRYESYIDYANRVREILNVMENDKLAGNHTLAVLTIGAIMEIREQRTGSKEKPCLGMAYILDQFKRPEEIELLRRVYGRLFVQISIHAKKESRRANLRRKIKESHASGAGIDFSPEAESLIRRDMSEEGKKHGQRVRDAFHLADVIIDVNDTENAKADIERFVKLLFGFNFVTPTHDEHGMYVAKVASLRSADLSRQVGAAIFTQAGEAITLGANEVPKPGGGTYFEGDKPDFRDFAQGLDYNEQEKEGIVRDLIKRMDEAQCLKLPPEADTLEKKVRYVMDAPQGPELKEARVMDLLEFGRQIHAEMNALCDAARLGRSVKDATLYCTTFPCHMCMKLILGSGIRRVVYLEPYPKSYAEEMYSDVLALEAPGPEGEKRILVQPFTGVAPFRYRDFFQKGRRKAPGGRAQEWKEGQPRPDINLIYETYISLEPQVMVNLAQRIAKAKALGTIQASS